MEAKEKLHYEHCGICGNLVQGTVYVASAQHGERCSRYAPPPKRRVKTITSAAYRAARRQDEVI